MTTVTLIDGRQVDSDSEEWRMECEARWIARMADRSGQSGLDRRRAYLLAVSKQRGPAATAHLETVIKAVWADARKTPAGATA